MHQPASIVTGLLLRRKFAMLATAGLACLASASQLGAEPVRYTVTDLGTIPGSTVCPCFFGIGLNNQGHVVGRFFGANGRYHGFLWRDGVMIDIGSLGGGITQVRAINDDGVATGNSGLSSGEDHAFIFQAGAGGQMIDLGTLGGTYSVGYAINAAGVVAGDAQTRGSNGNGPQSLQHAAIWGLDRRALDLGTLGGEFSQANGINDAGHVVGWAWNPARNHRGFVWRPGAGMIDLGDLGGSGSVVASDISNTGIIVGSAPAVGQPVGNTHAFRWAGGVIADLGVLPEAGQQSGPFGPELISTAATAVNSAGTIVGNSYPGTPEPPLRPGPFIWQNGVMTNLNDLIPPGWTMTEANDINEQGQIVGTALTSTRAIRAVLLTPVTCYANCDGSGAAPVLNVGDFICFQSRFAAGDPYADCDHSSSFTVNDFICFQSSFAAGCP